MEDSVKRVEHVWCERDDRWVYVEYNDINDIVGLNFMQGDEYDLFKKTWCKSDESLTEYYTQMLEIFNIEKQSSRNLGFINKVMWSYNIARSVGYTIV
jgi:hypothetical protein